MKTIKFYKTKDQYGFMSNFSQHSFTVDGKFYYTSEHYFQSKKFEGTEYEEMILFIHSPKECAQNGRNRSLPLRKDWEQVKDDIMREAVYAKFSQNEDIKQKLLDTGDAILIEHTENDSYWGDGGDGSGKSMLGKILMELREKFRNEG